MGDNEGTKIAEKSPDRQETEEMAEGQEQSLVDQILGGIKGPTIASAAAAIEEEEEEARKKRKAALEELLKALLQEYKIGNAVDKKSVNETIAVLDKKMSAQVDAILHDPSFQKLESAWRSLHYSVQNTDFDQNIKFRILNISKEELLNDFNQSIEPIIGSGLYKHVYSEEFGMHGGEPYGAMIANYEFGPGPQDMELLKNVSAVGAMSHAQFIASASPEFFGKETFLKMPNLKDIKGLFQTKRYTEWRAFRASDDSRNVGLTLPHFLLRRPFDSKDQPIKSFAYNETVRDSHDHYLWGNAAFAFATRLTDSFAKYRWCANIIGPKGGGQVENLPIHVFEEKGQEQVKIPTEIQITSRRGFQLSEEGFMPLEMRKDNNNACFFSANSVQIPKDFSDTPEGNKAKTNFTLGTQLPYMFIISRLSHYLKMLQREEIGRSKSRLQIEEELNKWIKQYVNPAEIASDTGRAKKPLRDAKVTVSEVDGQPGWYKIDLKIQPWFKYMGAYFTLSLVGKLDKE